MAWKGLRVQVPSGPQSCFAISLQFLIKGAYNQHMKAHYYGDIVRKLFIAGAVIMLLFLPFVLDRLPVSLFVSLLAIICFGLFAGLTNPKQIWVEVVNLIISIAAVVFFEFYAVNFYMLYDAWDLLFLAHQVLAILFFVALYYSTKTVRGMLLSE